MDHPHMNCTMNVVNKRNKTIRAQTKSDAVRDKGGHMRNKSNQNIMTNTCNVFSSSMNSRFRKSVRKLNETLQTPCIRSKL